MVAAPRPVRVEVLPLDAVLDEVLPGGRVRLDRAGRRDVVGRHRVAGDDEAARAGDVLDPFRLARHAFEVRRPADVRRVGIPLEQRAFRHRQLPPRGVAGEHVGVRAGEHLAAHRLRDRLLDLLRGRPDVAQVDVVPVPVLPERLVHQVDVHASCQRVRDHERRRSEVVRLHLRMDARLEVPVAAQHRADDEVALVHGLRDLLGQRAGVPDARRAAVPDRLEAECVEVFRKSSLLVILGHDLRARSERRLHPRLSLEAALDRVLREQSRGDHHARVRRVRAARDRGDHDCAVLELELLAVVRDALRLWVLGDRNRCGVCVPPAVAGRVRRRIARRERLRHRFVARVPVVDAERLERVDKRPLRLGERHSILRATRPCERRDDRREVELYDLRVLRLVRLVVPEEVLLAVRLDEREPFLAASGQPEVVERLLVDGEEPARRAVLR